MNNKIKTSKIVKHFLLINNCALVLYAIEN